jgi:hypothetical protein
LSGVDVGDNITIRASTREITAVFYVMVVMQVIQIIKFIGLELKA